MSSGTGSDWQEVDMQSDSPCINGRFGNRAGHVVVVVLVVDLM